MKIYIYYKNGNAFIYEVENAEKAREHAYAIWKTGYRHKVGKRHEWDSPDKIDKICWDGEDETYIAKKYSE